MAITVKELLQREAFFDCAIRRHGFTNYIRDYEIIVSGRDGPPYTDVHKYQFVGCVEAYYETTLGEWFNKSISDDFVYAGPEYPDQVEPDGFIWGIREALAYPGLEYVDNGERAAYWSGKIGRKMHEVLLETNAYRLRLVFADIRHSRLGHEPDAEIKNDYPLPVTEVTSDGCVA